MTATTDSAELGVTDSDGLPSRVSSRAAAASGLDARVGTRAPAHEPAETPTALTLGEYSRSWAANVRREFTPPNLWSQERPSLRASWLYARHGEQAGPDSTGRRMCQGSAWFAVPLRALALFVDWLAERPSRFLAAAVLYLVLAQCIPIAPEWLTF